MEDPKTPLFPKTSIEYSKAADYATVYANNAFLESSLWDLKVIFGQTDQQQGLNAVVQHTAVVLPWAQVKLMIYFMQSHLASHEAQNGRITLPNNLIPAVPDIMPESFGEAVKDAAKSYDAIKRVYKNFIADNPEAMPPSSTHKNK